VAPDVRAPDPRVQRIRATPSDEEPVRQTRSITAAIAWPKPMHMVAIP
jgi:hypothetical protein